MRRKAVLRLKRLDVSRSCWNKGRVPLERTWWRTQVGISAALPSGVIQPQRVLDWMQDAAASASTQGGYPPDRYAAMGASWFIREVILSIEAPIEYGAGVAIETWVSDLRRFRSRREYRAMSDAGVLLARAQADWVLLERAEATGKVRPLLPDEDLKAAFPRIPETVFAPDEVLEVADDDRERGVFEDKRTVRPSELDRHGHVNHVMYLGWLEDHARLAFGDERELSFVRMVYLADARLKDEVTIRGRPEGDLVHHVVERAGQPLLRAIMRRTSRARGS